MGRTLRNERGGLLILDPSGTVVLSSMGWVDRDSLWQFDSASGAARNISLNTGAAYCSIHTTGGYRFAAAHHFGGRRFAITVHEFSEPHSVIVGVDIAENASSISGDVTALADVPSLYVTYLAFEPWKDYVLIEIHGDGAMTIHRLPWYDASYDKDYQAVIDAVGVPGERQALISVQRSSRLVVQDLDSGEVVRTFGLGGGMGNPKLTPRNGAGEVWTTDYDMVAVVQTDRWKVRARTRLQDAAAGTQLFIGDLSFAPHHEVCVVARPYSHDVVALDLDSLKVRGTVTLGREPLEAAMLANGDVIARDWKTGDLLRGTLKV